MKKIIITLLMSFVVYQNLQSIDPAYLTAGQKIYSFNEFGMYNALIPSNATFQEIATVSVDASGNKTTIWNGKNYTLTASITAIKIGYVESQYVTNALILTNVRPLVDDTIFNQIYTSQSAFLQSYPTLEGGFIVLLGTNKAGQQNGENMSNPNFWNYTLYAPVYGVEVTA